MTLGIHNPAVVRDLQIGSFHGEILGKVSRDDRWQMAWVGIDKKEYQISGMLYQNAYVLCRVPNYVLLHDRLAGEDQWVSVRHGADVPKGTVQALDRDLNNSDPRTKKCYVAFW